MPLPELPDAFNASGSSGKGGPLSLGAVWFPASLPDRCCIRSTFLTGLTEEDYYGTVRVLQRMAENLERATGQESLIVPSSRS